MLEKVYMEITNVCNMSCAFCHKTTRKAESISEENFDTVIDKIAGKTKYVYFHLMGEPTLHPLLPKFIEKAKSKGLLPAITTNGTLLRKTGDSIISAKPYKISISLHAPAANTAFSDERYLNNCIEFAKNAAGKGLFVVLRLWNIGSGEDNSEIIEKLHESFQGEWQERRNGNSLRISTRIFLEFAERFEWPDIDVPECQAETDLFCYGLRDQVGILSDGTVVPCCLDADGNLALGNIYESSLDEIISSPRAKAIYDGFTRRRAVEPFCRKCGYAKRFSSK